MVILCRHGAYDGSWPVTADVAGPIGAINSAAQPGPAVECTSAPKRSLNHIVRALSVRTTGSVTRLDAVISSTPEKPRNQLAS